MLHTITTFLHEARRKISFRHEKVVFISFHCGRNEINFFFILIYDLCFYEIFTYAHVSFRMISFRGSVYMTFIIQSKFCFLSKWSQWNDNPNVFHFWVSHVRGDTHMTSTLKLDVQGQEGGRILDADGQGRWGVLKIGKFSWTSYVYHPLTGIRD